MLASFWAGLGDSLAERWLAAIFSPAFLFYAGGLVAWTSAHGGTDDWGRIERWMSSRSTVVQVALLVGALLVITVSGVIAQRVALPVLRLLEGYWPRWLDPVRRRLVDRQSRRFERADARFQALAPKIEAGTASSAEKREYTAADRSLRRFPSDPDPTDPNRLMPTRLGNILRAAESRPVDKYGLDAVRCWPRLWLVLPEAVKEEVNAARAVLDSAATVWLFGLLFIVWSVWAWWAALVGVAACVGAYVWMLGSAEMFGVLVESAFDLHRSALYRALRWPLPENPAAEHATGEALTAYLWWGSVEQTPSFTTNPE